MIYQPATFDDNWGYKSIAVFTGYTKLRKTYQGRAGLGKILRPQLLAFLLSWQDVVHSLGWSPRLPQTGCNHPATLNRIPGLGSISSIPFLLAIFWYQSSWIPMVLGISPPIFGWFTISICILWWYNIAIENGHL